MEKKVLSRKTNGLKDINNIDVILLKTSVEQFVN